MRRGLGGGTTRPPSAAQARGWWRRAVIETPQPPNAALAILAALALATSALVALFLAEGRRQA